MKLLHADETGIHFSNTITPNDTLNLLDYEYLYNGGGVGVGDFDGDGLPDLVFSGNQVASRIYLNKGGFEFEDITSQSDFDTKGHWCTGVSILDINADGLDDIYLCVGGPGKKSNYPNLLFINNGDLTFTESAASYGLADPAESIQSVFFDYDLDGDLDMFLLNGGGFEQSPVTVRPIRQDGQSRNTDRLFQNEFDDAAGHPVFRDVSKEAGITYEGFGLGAGVIDANKDGYPDIYVSNDYLSRDLLYINRQDGTFSEDALSYFRHMSHFSMGNDIGDVNNDGNPDIVTLDMLPRDHYRRKMMFGPAHYDRFHKAVNYGYGHQYMRNMLHIDNGEKGFSEIGQLAGIDRTDWSWCPLLADLDNDGLLDLFITNGYGKDITDLDFVKFRKDAIAPFGNPEETRKLLISSLDDLPAIVLPNYVFQNNGDYTFAEKVKEWGTDQPSISNGAAYADLDQDGDLDLIVNNIDQEAFIYRNQSRELHPERTHFLDIRLQGPERNLQGIGARIEAYRHGIVQVNDHQRVRGFQSSTGPLVHFGTGIDTLVDSLAVLWPDGRKNLVRNVDAMQTLTVKYADAREQKAKVKAGIKKKTMLLETDLISYVSKEIPHHDLKHQPLLLHGFAYQGPGMAVGDVNGDGLEDLFVGGPYGADASLFIQQADGRFDEHPIETTEYEDLGAIFLDADLDGDQDLYVTGGGSERYAGHRAYQDRLYLNDGSGHFEADTSRLPHMRTSTSIVTAGDLDQDGDLDLFVGGRVKPGAFPEIPESYVLKNESGTFIDITDQVSSKLKHVGMVTSALWTDFNNDGLQDLVVVGEFMRVSVFQNEGGHFVDKTEVSGLGQSTGMWNSIAAGDFDRDGDMDYVVGNIGKNTYFRSTLQHPIRLHFADFDANGSIDPIYSVYEEDDYYPLASLDIMTAQLPVLKKKVLHYRDYADATTKDLLKLLDVDHDETLECAYQSSILVENRGNGTFGIHELPIRVQKAPVTGILVRDVNQDGNPDILMVGNNYNTEVVAGRFDASSGSVLLNRGDLSFQYLDSRESGLSAKGDCRAIVEILLYDGQTAIFVSQNQDRLLGFIPHGDPKLPNLRFEGNEVSARIEFGDESTMKIEYQTGGGYLSQNSRTFIVPPGANQVSFINSAGKETRMMKTDEINKNI